MKTDNNGKYYVGKIQDNVKENGWFFGHFMDNPLLKSNDVEVAWQDISGKKTEPADKHTHKVAVEINIIISGVIHLTMDGKEFTVKAGEFYVVHPGVVVDKVWAEENTVDMCIKAPSVAGDKYYV
jgi:quercetin dioxygenase-like cupin family protein